MMTASIFGGRSRHGRSVARSSRPNATSQQHRPAKPREAAAAAEERVDPEPDKPNVEELRRKRIQYHALSPEARRRLTPTNIALRPKSKESATSRTKAVHGNQKKHRRKHKSSSDRPEKSADAKTTRTEEHVYGTTSTPIRSREEPVRRRMTSSPDRSQRPSRTSRRHTLPVLAESDITPNDSISQVGVHPSIRSVSNRRSTPKRSSTSSARLSTILDKEIEDQATTAASRQSSRRQSQPSLLGLLRRNTAPTLPTPPRLVECLTCAADDVPRAKSAKLACNHRMCHDCLKRIFELSVKDPAHMPPKCCTDQHIPLQHVDELFDLKFKMHWNRKYREFHTKNRIYCPAPKCGKWISPTHVHSSEGRKYAQCPRCNTKVCMLCNGKLHRSKDCPEDPEIAKLVAQAKDKGWQPCYNCHAMVELKEGCNHMTCRCRAEFCMLCGAKWKTCECPWFNHSRLPDPDRLMEWRVPEPIQNLYQRVFDEPEPYQPMPLPERRRTSQDQSVDSANRQWPPTYADEMNQRRRQERLDAALARRLQLASLLEPGEPPIEPRRQRPNLEP